MAKAKKKDELIERPWKFGIGQSVKTDEGGGKVTWRRENSQGVREYQVATKGGDVWLPEKSIEAAK